MLFPAHIHEDDAGKRVQTAEAHCENAAKYAGACLRAAGLEEAGALAGLLHDCGKFKREFARYIESGAGAKGSVNHTFAGFRLIMERYHGETAATTEALSAELLGIAIGAHHGLFDCINAERKSGMAYRLAKEGIGYEESCRNFLEHFAADELDERFARAHLELSEVYEKIRLLSGEDDARGECAFYLGLLARLLLSAVIEGDRRDTAEFMGKPERMSAPEDMRAFWRACLKRVEEKLNALPQDAPIQRARREISDRCRSFAEKPAGVYRLNVPTGAGKTLSSLRYALAHGAKWGKRRLIFTSPLLSILDQNAAELRKYIGDDSVILEHHSNVLREDDEEARAAHELAMESWDKPIIITTLVQFLNALFDGKTAAIRRLQALCGSVIVIDEVQTALLKMLSLFNLSVNFLAAVCGATVLLCSATQPCLEEIAHPIRCDGDMIPFDAALWKPFRRTRIVNAGTMTLEEVCGFARREMEHVRSLLLVCNKRAEAEMLYRALSDCADACVHLSAAMCAAHRQEALNGLKSALTGKRKCLCVATQVIEAGVDISFECVIRLSAGMDSVIQAAGRCNRNAERADAAEVYVVPCRDERLERLDEILKGKHATDSLLDAYRRKPDQFGNDLASDAAIRYYYRKLYASIPEDYPDYCIKERGVTLFQLLSENLKYYDENAEYADRFCMTQAFHTAGALFRVFDSDTLDLVVPYGEGRKLIAELEGNPQPDLKDFAEWLERVKPYTVSAYAWQMQKLVNAVREIGGVSILNPRFYDKDVGLNFAAAASDFQEVRNG